MKRKVRLRNGSKTYVERSDTYEAYAYYEECDGNRRQLFTAAGSYLANGKIHDYDIVAWDIDGLAPSAATPNDIVNHPSHYTSHPSGVECITLTEHMPFNIGNVFKYLWRAGLKNSAPTAEDYNKACWYLIREMKRQGVKLTVGAAEIEGAR